MFEDHSDKYRNVWINTVMMHDDDADADDDDGDVADVDGYDDGDGDDDAQCTEQQLVISRMASRALSQLHGSRP